MTHVTENLDKYRGHYAKVNKPATEGQYYMIPLTIVT